jgi:flagella basal body P-ring formation protein FlgA
MMIHRLRLMVVAVLMALNATGMAMAATEVELRPQIFDTDGQVSLSDIFVNTGTAGARPLWTMSGPSLVLDSNEVKSAALRAGLHWSNSEGLLRVIVRTSGVGAGPRSGNVQVLAWARSIAAGDMVAAEDVIWTTAATAPAGSLRDPDVIVGQIARRALRQGAAVSSRDLMSEQVIKRGDVVLVTWHADGVSLAMQGRAQSDAGIGEPVTVQNPTSRKNVDAIASGPGQAEAGPDVRPSRPSSQIAAR